ncbi:prepilin-type N-terminal cleavage/methylation domain-containing protein [Methylophaga sp. OBS3]|uniref:prepilin-type N-terminal cleavage/methylation domain-containing protein n=1 Tax=Methylophaga sp. OBS3 TaxID=2991934 RepID=UPI002258AC8C|nr:prepilin-type N-terminal cleavage/methylation domain-containing protein [Methylophaga sp. OBS3]MCX4189162.1 prepilin-type N-terminal cleavage/methylation domain-containing protein [Methylophaga sp. OBS3]
MPETRPSHSKKCLMQQGFTLLELVLVLFLIGLLASAGLLFTENLESQAKYEETQKRIELIRRAIVGDLTRTVNGGPELSGFVADVGRLPLCIKELIELGDPDDDPDQFKSPCASDDAFNLRVWQIDSDTGVGAGWRGPYISLNADKDGVKRFRDGYGNGEDADINFGWNWQLATGISEVDTIGLTPPLSAVQATNIHLKSDGFDIDAGNDEVPIDGSDFLTGNDWLYPSGETNQSEIDLRFAITEALSAEITVKTFLERTLVNPAFLAESLSNSPDTDITFPVSSVGVGIPRKVIFDRNLPMGRYLFRLDCPVSCVPDSYVITILPRQTIAPLEFRIIP